jgi:hypothetical protein
MIPSQMDDISSISPNDHTHILVQNADKHSGGGTSTYKTAPEAARGCKRQSVEPLSREPSDLHLQPSSSSINLQRQNQEGQGPYHHKKPSLKRDLSAQTELNSTHALQMTSGTTQMIPHHHPIGQTNTSEEDGGAPYN